MGGGRRYDEDVKSNLLRNFWPFIFYSLLLEHGVLYIYIYIQCVSQLHKESLRKRKNSRDVKKNKV